MARRVILGIVGGLLLLLGLAAGVSATWGYLFVGTEGLVRVGAGTITPGPESLATVIDVDRFAVTVPYVGGLGDAQLAVEAADGGDDPVFLGAAVTDEADRFLIGVPYSAAFRDSGDWQVRDIPGGAAAPATSTGTWLAQDTGRHPAITVPSERPLSLVVLRPSGAPTGPIDVSVDFTVRNASTWLLSLLISAVVLILLGAVCLFFALRRRRPLGKHAAAPGAVTPDAASLVAAQTGQSAATTDAGEPEVTAEARATDETAELPVVDVPTEPPPAPDQTDARE